MWKTPRRATLEKPTLVSDYFGYAFVRTGPLLHRPDFLDCGHFIGVPELDRTYHRHCIEVYPVFLNGRAQTGDLIMGEISTWFRRGLAGEPPNYHHDLQHFDNTQDPSGQFTAWRGCLSCLCDMVTVRAVRYWFNRWRRQTLKKRVVRRLFHKVLQQASIFDAVVLQLIVSFAV